MSSLPPTAAPADATAAASDSSAILERGMLPVPPGCAHNHTVSVVEPEPGVLLAAWVAGPVNRDPRNAVWMAWKREGRWYPPYRDVDSGASDATVFNPVLVRREHGKNAGELLLFHKAGPSPDLWTGYLRRSSDGGAHWSAPVTLPAGMTGVVRSRPLELADGTLLCGDSVEAWRAWAGWVNETRDAGRTWRRHGPIAHPTEPWGLIQPVIFKAGAPAPAKAGGIGGDGSETLLRALLRPTVKLGLIHRSDSTDGGATWSAPEAVLSLPNPNSAVDVVRLDSGRLVIAHNLVDAPGSELKNRLALSVSDDGGVSWRTSLVLVEAPEGEFSYPALLLDSAGKLHVLYTHRRQAIGEVVVDPALLP